MIIKGNLHDNGAKLARYMIHGKRDEQAELWQVRGFAELDVIDAFRSIHIMSEATQCEKPFFHVQVRNAEHDRALMRDEWERIADRIEARIGYHDQPRAIAFHIDMATGQEHMHIAWSRIDDEKMKARPLPYYKQRLKSTARELEEALGLTRVRNEREAGEPRSARRNEAEQSRRLEVDGKDIRQTIRNCYERSDNGKSLQHALADEGLILARGDKRDFVVIDHAGGIHALNGRLLDDTAKKVVQRLSDLDREGLPSVKEAREQQVLLYEREREERGGHGGDGSQESQLHEAERDTERDYIDRDTYEQDWYDGLVDAAIEHTHEQDAIRATMDSAVKEMEKERSRKLYLEKQAEKTADRITARDTKWAAYRTDRDLAANLAIKIVHADNLGEIQQLAKDRCMAFAEEEGKIYAVTARYKFAYDSMMQRHLHHVFGGQAEHLPHVKEAKREARQLEHAVEGIREPQHAPELGKTAGAIRLARSLTDSAQAFVDALEDHGLILAQVTAADIENYRSTAPLRKPDKPAREPWMTQTGGTDALSPEHRESAERSYENWNEEYRRRYSFEDYVEYVQKKWAENSDKANEKYAYSKPSWREGELVVVDQFGGVTRLTERTTGLKVDELKTYLQDIDRQPLLSVTEAQEAMATLQEHRREEWRRERRREWVEQQRDKHQGNEDMRAIEHAYADTQTGPAFAQALAERGFTLCRVSESEAERSQTQRHWLGNTPVYKAGEYLALNERGHVYRLNGITIYDDEERIFPRLAEIDDDKVLNFSQAQQVVAAQRETTELSEKKEPVTEKISEKTQQFATAGKMATGIAGKFLGGAVRVAESVMEAFSDFFTGGGSAQETQQTPQRQAQPKRSPHIMTPQQRETLRRTNPEVAERDPGVKEQVLAGNQSNMPIEIQEAIRRRAREIEEERRNRDRDHTWDRDRDRDRDRGRER